MKQINQKNPYVLKIINDLKIPTLAQIGALESFIKTSSNKLSEEENNLILLTLNSCTHMENLIEIYSTLENLNRNTSQLNYEKFDIVKLVNERFSKENIIIKYKKLELSLNSLNPILLNADKFLIKKAIDNIINCCLEKAFIETNIAIWLKEEKNNIHFKISYKWIAPNFETNQKAYKKQNLTKLFEEQDYDIGLHLANKIILAHFGIMLFQEHAQNENLICFKMPV